jgi:hypothetical protein
MDYTYRERHGEAIYRFKVCPREGGGWHIPERLLPPQPRIGVLGRLRLKLPGGAIGIRLRDVIGPDNMM